MEDPKNPNQKSDSALNPESQGAFSVLDQQKEKTKPESPSGVHDLAEFPLDKRPTEVSPLSETFDPRRRIRISEKISDVYKIDPRVLRIIGELKNKGRSVGWVGFSLEHAESRDHALGILSKYYKEGTLLKNEYEEMMSVLEESESSEKKETSTVLPRSKNNNEVKKSSFEIPQALLENIRVTIEKEPNSEVRGKLEFVLSDLQQDLYINSADDVRKALNTYRDSGFISGEQYLKMLIILEEEIYEVPSELISYLNGLEKKDTSTRTLSETLKNDRLSKREVLATLYDSFYHLKILSKEEYESALIILGQLPEKETEIEKEKVVEKNQSDKVEEPFVEPKQEAQIEELDAIDFKLEQSRLDYAQAKIEYNRKNNKLRKVKELLGNLISDETSGAHLKEKTQTELELEEIKNKMEFALGEYLEAKKQKVRQIISIFVDEKKAEGQDPGKSDEEIVKFYSGQVKIKLLEQAEKEWDALQIETDKLILETENEKVKKIKEIGRKALEKWSKVPQPVRLAIAPLLIGTGVGLTAGLGVGALYTGSRLSRGVGAFVGAKGVSNLYDRKIIKTNEDAVQKYNTEYLKGVSGDLFEENEKRYMDARQKERERMKWQKIKKATLMVGAGAGAGILTGLAESSVENILASKPTISTDSISAKPKSFDGIARTRTVSPIETHTQPPVVDVLDTKVELSSKGFLQDIHSLKAQIIRHYGHDIPSEIKTNILDKPTVELAKEYGLYRPGDPTGESALGFAGEKLSVDTSGHLVIEHIDGTKDFLSDQNTGEVKPFEGKMFSVETPEPQEISKAPEVLPTDIQKPTILATETEIQTHSVPDEVVRIPTENVSSEKIETSKIISPNHIPYGDSFVDVVDKGGIKIVTFNGVEIAHEQAFGNGKILKLDDKFQEGAQNINVRGAFAEAFERNALVSQIGEEPIAIPFEGGKIYVIYSTESDPLGAKVLLNGKEIAKGVLKTKGEIAGLELKFDGNLKGGWFLADNAYERAFKHAKKFLQIK